MPARDMRLSTMAVLSVLMMASATGWGAAADRNLVANGGFEEGLELPDFWRSIYYFGPGLSLVPVGPPAAGRCVLVHRVTAATDLRQTGLKLSPEHKYRVSARFRTQDFRQHGVNTCTVAVLNRGWGWDCRLFPPEGTNDWTTVSKEFTPGASDDGRYAVTIYASGMEGSVWVDDVRVEALTDAGWQASGNDNLGSGRPPRLLAYLLQPRMNTLVAGDGKVTVRAETQGVVWPEKQPRRLRWQATAGSAKRTGLIPYDRTAVPLDLGKFPAGATVSLILSAVTQTGQTLVQAAPLQLAVADPRRPAPANACLIDRRGRAIVGGKPFLPIGLYLQGVSREIIADIAASDFNTVMPYASLALRLDPKQPVSETSTLEAMDALAANDLKVIFALNGVTDVPEAARAEVGRHIGQVKLGWLTADKEWCGAHGAAEIVARAATMLRNHPALLAWYVADELPPVLESALLAKRRMLNDLDPFHPTWAVHCDLSSIVPLGGTADVIGLDPYAISNADSRDMWLVERYCAAARKTGLPAWNVPQLFDWGAYIGTAYDGVKSDEEIARLYAEKRSRPPTEQELRSMVLEMARQGTKGFVFYSYYDLVRNKVVAQSRDQRWAEAKRVAALLQELTPFLLSDKDPTETKLAVSQGTVYAGRFTDSRGRVRVLITAIGPGEAEAVIDLGAQEPPLYSRYGGTVALGAGRYRFRGSDIASDVLTDEPTERQR